MIELNTGRKTLKGFDYHNNSEISCDCRLRHESLNLRLTLNNLLIAISEKVQICFSIRF